MSKLLLAALAVTALTPALAFGAPTEPPFPLTLTLRDHRFSPSAVSVAAGRPIDVTLTNQDATIEEFDSDDLGVEETVHPKETVHFRIPAQKTGSYDFMGEFHSHTAQGRLTVTPQ